MYVPRPYVLDRSGWAVELIRGNPLATLVTNGDSVPFVTHLPVIVPPDADPELVGVELLGHLNKVNPHASALVDGQPVVLVVRGPHGYVSPCVYGTAPAAPTWNFTAVHVHGTLRLIHEPEETLRVVRATVAALEERHGRGWDMTGSIEYFRRILPGVQAFAVTVCEVYGMAKLSQEQSPEVRRRVADAFATSERGLHRELASMMRTVMPPPAD